MKLLVITTCDNKGNAGWQKLEASLQRFGYDYHCIEHPFTFGTQMGVIQKWCNEYSGDATHILYTDAFDTVAFAGPGEVINKFTVDKFVVGYTVPKMLISAEKNCYPHPERAVNYPEVKSAWKYVNGGGWITEIEFFKQLCIKENLNQHSHDQVWLMDAYLNNRDEIKLDTECEIFQTIAFSNQDEWEVTPYNRLYNVATDTQPVFFHGNGHTEMNWVYEMLK